LIQEHLPRGLRSAFAALAGLPGTVIYRGLEEGKIVYWSAILRKPLGRGAGSVPDKNTASISTVRSGTLTLDQR
jgi:hypothetical protein